MASYQKSLLLGNLGRDAEIRYTPTGQPVVNMQVAATERWKTKEGVEKEHTEWFRVYCFATQAQAEKYFVHFKKGNEVFVEGRLRTRSYEKDGVTRYVTELRADVIKMTGGKREEKEMPATAAPEDFADTTMAGITEDAAPPAVDTPPF